MPDSPTGFCPAKGCSVRSKGPCEKHRRRRDKDRDVVRHDNTTRALYRTNRWRVASERQRAKDPWCWYCLQKGVRKLSEETDHIEAASLRPDLFFAPENHRSACKACNAAKGDREG